jgi:hypothetical protein
MSDNDTNQICLTQELLSNSENNDTLIFPNIDFWKRFLTSIKMNVFPNLDNNIGKNNLNYNYRAMAVLLFQDEQRFSDVRCFFYYLMQSIEFMSLENCLLFKPDIKVQKNSLEERIVIFQKNVWNTITFCESIYGYPDLKKYNVPGKKDDIMEIFTSIDLHNAIRYIKQKQLVPSYPGTDLEWSLFCAIFNIDLQFFHGFSLEHQGLNKDINQRKWVVKKKVSPSVYSCNNIFNFFIKQGLNHYCPIIEYEEKKLLIINETIFEKLKYNDTTMHYKISRWINNRYGKLFFPGFREIVSPPYKFQKESFLYNDYVQSTVSVTKLYLIAIMLDPLETWIEQNIIYIPSNGLSILNYLTFRPTTYISSTIIDEYIKYLNKKFDKTKSILVTVGELTSYFHNANIRSKLEEKVSKYKHIICPVCVENTHWITMEFKMNDKKTSSIEVWIADSNHLNNENLLLKYDNIKKAASNVFLFISKLCILEKLHPVINNNIPVTKEEANALDAFYKKIIVLRQAAFIIPQINEYDCAICCLQRMERILTSTNRTAELNKNTPASLLIPTRQFRLIILENLIPDNLSTLHHELLNINTSPFNKIRIPDVYEIGVNDPEDDEDVDELNINMHASVIEENDIPLPMENEILTIENRETYPMENDVVTTPNNISEVQLENDLQEISQPSVQIDTIDSTFKNKENKELCSQIYDGFDNLEENRPNSSKQKNVGNNTTKTIVNVTTGTTASEPVYMNVESSGNGVTQQSYCGKVPRPEFASIRHSSSSDEEEETYLPRAPPNGGIIRTDLNSDSDVDNDLPNEDNANSDNDSMVEEFNTNDDNITVAVGNHHSPMNEEVNENNGINYNIRTNTVGNHHPPLNEDVIENNGTDVDNHIIGTELLQHSKLQEIIQKFDENKKTYPIKKDIELVSTKLVNLLENKKRKKLPENQRENWEVNAFDHSQLNETNSKEAILSVVRKQLNKQRRQLREIEVRLERENTNYENSRIAHEKERLLRSCKSIRNEWIECKSNIFMNEYHEEHTYLFHTKSNIKALKKIVKKIINRVQTNIMLTSKQNQVKNLRKEFVTILLKSI